MSDIFPRCSLEPRPSTQFFFHSRGRPGFKATLGVYVGICMAYVWILFCIKGVLGCCSSECVFRIEFDVHVCSPSTVQALYSAFTYTFAVNPSESNRQMLLKLHMLSDLRSRVSVHKFCRSLKFSDYSVSVGHWVIMIIKGRMYF